MEVGGWGMGVRDKWGGRNLIVIASSRPLPECVCVCVGERKEKGSEVRGKRKTKGDLQQKVQTAPTSLHIRMLMLYQSLQSSHQLLYNVFVMKRDVVIHLLHFFLISPELLDSPFRFQREISCSLHTFCV